MDDPKKKPAPPANAVAMTADPTVSALAQRVQQLESEARAHKAQLEQSEREQLVASRPDLAESLRAMVLDKAHPIATVRAMIAAVPQGAPPASTPTSIRAATIAS